jgi:hypothetical protein
MNNAGRKVRVFLFAVPCVDDRTQDQQQAASEAVMLLRCLVLASMVLLAGCPLLGGDELDGCPAVLAMEQCGRGGVIVQADCSNGDRWEVIANDDDDFDDYSCRFNGEPAGGDSVDICGLDPENDADRAQILIRARSVCGID